CRDMVRLSALATARALLQTAPAQLEASAPQEAPPPDAPLANRPLTADADENSAPTLSPGEALAFDELARRLGDGLRQPPPSGDPPLPPAADDGVQSIDAALHRAHDRIRELETILDTATDGVSLLDRDARILNANHSAQALFG